ncbi:MAG: flagellar basal-body MS-ring/collar protein FliF [Candidatus Tectimicrobiota bacterium]
MLDQLKTLLQNGIEYVRQMPPTKLFFLLGGIVAVLVLGLFAVFKSSAPAPEEQHKVLFSQLSAQDAGAIVAKLKDMNIPYSLKGDGSTILVPAPMVLDVRLRMYNEGLPQGGGVGYEIFDKHDLLGARPVVDEINRVRALQGELARTITNIAAIRSARVHLVIPKKALFREQQDKTTASVFLTLTPGRRLAPEQVRSIMQFVASSVPGLDPMEVIVLDDMGQRLSHEEAKMPAIAQNDAQLQHQRRLESELESKVQSLLEPALGKGKVRARVSATLDFQQLERTEERYDAENPATRSQQRSKEEGTGSGYWSIGPPGVRPNTEGAQIQNPADKATSARQTETINYELSKTVSKLVAPTGDIKRLSVGVLVDGTYQPGEKAGERKYVPRSAEELAKFRDIVRGAVGYNESRGDKVEVASMPFEPESDLDAPSQREAQRAFWAQLVGYGAYVILGLLFCLFVARPLIAALLGQKAEPVIEAMLPRTVQELEAGMDNPNMLLEPAAVGAAPTPLMVEPAKPTGASLRAQVTEIAKRDPEHTLEILRMWLKRG